MEFSQVTKNVISVQYALAKEEQYFHTNIKNLLSITGTLYFLSMLKVMVPCGLR